MCQGEGGHGFANGGASSQCDISKGWGGKGVNGIKFEAIGQPSTQRRDGKSAQSALGGMAVACRLVQLISLKK